MEKLDKALEQFEMLKQNASLFDIKQRLDMASSIRDNLLTGESIVTACKINSELYKKRKQLLDDIHEFQMNLIQENIKKDGEISFLDSHVIDFDKAKASLSRMIDEELKSQMFMRTESSTLYENIEETKTHIESLKRVSSNCKHGKYKVLIMGEFQSGKSTTIDAFCDGRHISAIGEGSPTSAVLVYVSYAEKESMHVQWRDEEQFAVIFNRIKPYFPGFDWDGFDLKKSNLRSQLVNRIENLRASDLCPSVGDGNAKFLMIADFILQYYDTAKLKEKKALLESISDIAQMTRFPKNGDALWKKFGTSHFTIDEIIFVFVQLVECFTPSETLKRLNCTCIDSPGLFNDSYDTMVTEMAMVDAHAIMYVLPYDKAIKDDMCKSLNTIKKNYQSVHRKLFVVNNLSLIDSKDVYESNLMKIQSMFGEEKSVYPYDAKMSYWIKLRQLYDKGQATYADYGHWMSVTQKTFGPIANKLDFSDFHEAWSYHIRSYKSAIPGEDAQSMEKALVMSGFQNIVDTLKEFIANNESYAVIVSNGIEPMYHELNSIRNSLCLRFIEPYISTHDSVANKWIERIENAKQFQTIAKEMVRSEIFDSNGSNSLYDRMAINVYNELFTYDFYSHLAESIAGVLYDNKGKLLLTKTLLSDKEKFREHFDMLGTPIIKDKIFEIIKDKLNYFISTVERDQNATVNNQFTPSMQKIDALLRIEWSKLFLQDEGMNMDNYFFLPKTLKSSKYNENDSRIRNPEYNSTPDIFISATMLGALVAQITMLVVGIVSMIAGYITVIFCDLSGIALFTSLMLLGGGTVLVTIAPDKARKWIVDMISSKLLEKITLEAYPCFQSVSRQVLGTLLEQHGKKVFVDIEKMEKERDMALTPVPNQEDLCFRAVEQMVKVDSQVNTYNDFIHKNIENGTI